MSDALIDEPRVDKGPYEDTPLCSVCGTVAVPYSNAPDAMPPTPRALFCPLCRQWWRDYGDDFGRLP